MLIVAGVSPFSTDPMEVDAFNNHFLMRSLVLTLVSDSPKDGIRGGLAKTWGYEGDSGVWTFNLYPHLRFENGDPITAHDVLASLERSYFLMSLAGSKENLFRYVAKDSSGKLKIFVAGEHVLKIEQGLPNDRFLELLTFPLYSIVSRSDWDPVTRLWKDKQKINASGPYRLAEWNGNEIVLEHRNIEGTLSAENPPKKVMFVDDSSSLTPDIVYSHNLSTSIDRRMYRFSTPVDLNFAYAHLFSWRSSELFSDWSLRTEFMNCLTENLQELGQLSSFFPLGEARENSHFLKSVARCSGAAKDRLRGRSVKTRKWETENPLFNRFWSALAETAKELEMILTYAPEPTNDEWFGLTEPNLKEHFVDIAPRASGVLVTDPTQDLRFMFMSSEGIRLPDPTGNIERLLMANKPSILDIESQLYKDRVVLPLGHYRKGFWFNSRVNVDSLNLMAAAIDFSWVSFSP